MWVSSIISGPDQLMTDIIAQTAFVTEVQQACRKAKESRSADDLRKASDLLDHSRFNLLEPTVRSNCRDAFTDAYRAVYGVGAG